MRKYILFLLFVLISSNLRADLLWSKDSGWRPTQDVKARFDSDPDEALQLMNDARLAQEGEKFGTALSKYERVYKKFPNTIFAPEAYRQYGKIRVARSQFNDAFKAFNEIIKKYPEYPNFNDVLREEFEIAQMLKKGERPKYFGIIPGMRDYQTAVNFYNKIIDNAPFSDTAQLALMHIGELAMSNNKKLDAIAGFERLIDEYPYSEYAPDAYFNLAEIYSSLIKSPLYDQGATKLSMNYYEDFLTLYPNHERVSEAKAGYNAMKRRLAESKLLIGDFYFQSRNNRKAAVIMYKCAQKTLPDSEISQKVDVRVNFIKEGNLPKKTPVDFLFGRYKRPADEEWIDEAIIDSKDSEEFELMGGVVKVDEIANPQYRNFGNVEDETQPEPFIEPTINQPSINQSK